MIRAALLQGHSCRLFCTEAEESSRYSSNGKGKKGTPRSVSRLVIHKDQQSSLPLLTSKTPSEKSIRMGCNASRAHSAAESILAIQMPDGKELQLASSLDSIVLRSPQRPKYNSRFPVMTVMHGALCRKASTEEFELVRQKLISTLGVASDRSVNVNTVDRVVNAQTWKQFVRTEPQPTFMFHGCRSEATRRPSCARVFEWTSASPVARTTEPGLRTMPATQTLATPS
jgi:hypothetical protein